MEITEIFKKLRTDDAKFNMKATSEINSTRLVLRARNDSKDQSIYCEVKGELNLLWHSVKIELA